MKVRVTQEHMATFRVGGCDAEVAEIPMEELVLIGGGDQVTDNAALRRRVHELDTLVAAHEARELAMEMDREELETKLARMKDAEAERDATIRRLADENAALKWQLGEAGLSIAPEPSACATARAFSLPQMLSRPAVFE